MTIRASSLRSTKTNRLFCFINSSIYGICFMGYNHKRVHQSKGKHSISVLVHSSVRCSLLTLGSSVYSYVRTSYYIYLIGLIQGSNRKTTCSFQRCDIFCPSVKQILGYCVSYYFFQTETFSTFHININMSFSQSISTTEVR